MQTDAFFTIGITHKVCQDYALADHESVLLSDGCSSAHDTDIGARLLCRAGRKFIGSKSPAAFFDGAISKSQYYAQSLDLSLDSLLATIMCVQLNSERTAYEVLLAGDGVIAAKSKQGWTHVSIVDFESGAPFYLRYGLDANAVKTYCERFGSWIRRSNYIIMPDGKINTDIPRPEERWEGATEVKCSDCGGWGRFRYLFGLDEFEFVSVMSDGAKSFYQPKNTGTSLTTETIPLPLVLAEVLAFKGFNGEFVQRRCIKAFEKFRESNWLNADDFSLAVLANK